MHIGRRAALAGGLLAAIVRAAPSSGVRLSVPTAVLRTRGYSHFPIMGVAHGSAFAMTWAGPDKANIDAPALVAFSTDDGAAWSDAVSVRAAGATLGRRLLPFDLADDGAGTLFAPSQVVRRCGAVVPDAVVTVSGWQRPSPISDGVALYKIQGQPRAVPGGWLVTLYGVGSPLVCAFSSDGVAWQIRGTIAQWSSAEGATESGLIRLRGGRLMCVFRTGSYHQFSRAYSHDEGATWSASESLPGIGSVCPRLARLGDGSILLVGGRPGHWLWRSIDDGATWDVTDLMAHHNATVASEPLHPSWTSSYVALAELPDGSALLAYDRGTYGGGLPVPDVWAPGITNSLWAVRVSP